MVLEQELLPYLTWLLGYPWREPAPFLDSAACRFLIDGRRAGRAVRSWSAF